jgi:hypothetical protein
LIVEDAIVSVTGITGDAGTEIITAPATAFVTGQPIRFTALTGGAGLNTTTNYFVVNPVGATFQVETSIGGGAINFTTNITAGTLLTGHSVQVNVTLSENTTETNSALVLTPKGTGAFILGPKPDGTATGGNARGAGAVDLQISRTAAAQVASASNSFIAGGSGHTASGGNNAICGGAGNTASGNFASTLGSASSTASSNYSSVIGGFGNSASGTQSLVCSGESNQASNTYSITLGGQQALADRRSMHAHSGGQFSSKGDAQRARFVLRCKTTTNAAVEMALDGATTYLTIPAGKVMFMNIKVTGSKSDGSAVATYERQYAVKHISATATSSEIYAPITIGTDFAAGTSLEVAVVDAGDYVRIRPTGIAAETWRWVASVDAVEVAYGT